MVGIGCSLPFPMVSKTEDMRITSKRLLCSLFQGLLDRYDI